MAQLYARFRACPIRNGHSHPVEVACHPYKRLAVVHQNIEQQGLLLRLQLMHCSEALVPQMHWKDSLQTLYQFQRPYLFAY